MTETQRNPLAENFSTVSLIQFAFPSMVMMLFMGLYTIVDTIFVARYVDTNALSSINIVCPIINIIVGLGTMLGAGGSAYVAKKMGSSKNEEARSDFTLIIITGIMIGLVITVMGLLFLDEIVWGLGASEILFPYCKDYLMIQLIFAIGNIMQVLYQNLFVTAGKPTLGLVLSVLAGVANIVFDSVFIVLLKMGIKGAALGTGIGYMIPTVIGTLFFLRGSSISETNLECGGRCAAARNEGALPPARSELYFCKPKMDASVLIKSCSNGMSEMVSQLSTAVTTFLFNATMMSLLGEDGVAAITVIIYSQFLLTTLYIGFSMGVAPVVSYHYGNGNVNQLKKIIRICFRFIMVISILVFLFSFVAGESIARIFAESNENVFEIIKAGFRIFSFSFLFSGCNIFSSALFTALSDGKTSAVISFLRTFGFITVFLFVLPKFLQVIGVWLAIPAAEFLTLILVFIRIINSSKQNITHNSNAS